MIDNIFEMMMLLCFAAAWPFSIYRSYKSRSTKGKSVYFSFIILAGYVFGITNKFVMDQVNYVVFFYCLGFGLVFIDTMLYFRNRSIEKKEMPDVSV